MCVVHVIYSLCSVETRIQYVEANGLVMLWKYSRASDLTKRMAVNTKRVVLMMRRTVVKITHVAARHSVKLLQPYFVKQGSKDANNAALDRCAEQVFSKAASEMRQNTLDSFML